MTRAPEKLQLLSGAFPNSVLRNVKALVCSTIAWYINIIFKLSLAVGKELFEEGTIMAKENIYKEVVVDGITCIEFITDGKNKIPVLVDKKAWDKYLHEYHWTAIKKGKNYMEVISTRKLISVRLHRVIVEHEKAELDYWGNTVDHKNNNPLDNRLSNLAIFNNKLNPTNIKSKFQPEDNQLIHAQRGGGWKIHTNVYDIPIYKNFSTLEEARAYRNKDVYPIIKAKIAEMIKKTRDIEFERGLRDKLNNNEKEEVLTILKKYGIVE